MIRWLAVVTSLAAVVALRALPPATVELPRLHALPEQLVADSLESELRRAHTALRALRWSDSLSALAVGSATEGVTLSPPSSESMDPEAVEAWVAARREELLALGPGEQGVAVGIFWVPTRHSSLPSVPLRGANRPITFVGVRDGTLYCLQAEPYTERTSARLLQFWTGAPVCTLYAAYGPPGPHVQEWLAASSSSFARIHDPSLAVGVARADWGGARELELFGPVLPRYASVNLSVRACLAGRPAACERALTDPELIGPPSAEDRWVLENAPVVDLGLGTPSAPFGYLDDALLFELEARYGREAFRGFWTSADPVPLAFEAGFGAPLGAWTMEWVQGHLGSYRAGPGIPWSALLWSLGTLGLFAAVATRAQVGRSAG